MSLFFLFFLVSGFCSLVFQVVWLRLAMAQFGVTTPLVSIFLAVFMAGLAIGSWAAGRWTAATPDRSPGRMLRAWALVELLLGLSAFVVPPALERGGELLRGAAGSGWASGSHYLASGAWVTLVLLPFCLGMGATFPLVMAAVRTGWAARAGRSFSYLYVANVAGALLGTLASAYLLIESFGLRRTLILAAGLNFTIALVAGLRSLGRDLRQRTAEAADDATRQGAGEAAPGGFGLPLLLLTTGLVSMAMEVVWLRQFTPFLGTEVYAFANVLAVYLAATVAGALACRSLGRRLSPGRFRQVAAALWVLAAPLALLPLVGADFSRAFPSPWLRVAFGIAPLCAALGFLTPMLVDRWSGGDPRRAGAAYAVNALGCILGPLLAGFVLLPRAGATAVLVLLALPLAGAGLAAVGGPAGRRGRGLAAWLAALAVSAVLVATSHGIEDRFPGARIERDATATTLAVGEGMKKRLLVNGWGMTYLTPLTKLMAHLPLVALEEPPRSGLVICLGMGTTFRSVASWGIESTAVELVPGVARLFDYFHADAPDLLAAPGNRIVVDDGRRFLELTEWTFDVVVIDPPPPISAAGSSLLYSTEMYELIRRRLRPGGILQQWVPHADPVALAAIVKALEASFPHVRDFGSISGWGHHLLASDRPIRLPSAAEIEARMPAAAVRDLLEWGPAATATAQLAAVFAAEHPPGSHTRDFPDVPALDDDHPVNEYDFLRDLARAGWHIPGTPRRKPPVLQRQG